MEKIIAKEIKTKRRRRKIGEPNEQQNWVPQQNE